MTELYQCTKTGKPIATIQTFEKTEDALARLHELNDKEDEKAYNAHQLKQPYQTTSYAIAY